MKLLIKIEVTGNNIHQIFKVKAIRKMPTLCIMGKSICSQGVVPT